MGLSAMQNAPDMDQAMRYANISGQMQTIQPNAWVGEQNLNGLGLSDDSGVPGNQVSNVVNPLVGAFNQIYSTIQAGKAAKHGSKNRGQVQPQPTAQGGAMAVGHEASGSSDSTKWLLYGGLALAGIFVIVMVMKKKKKAGGE